jgi:NNP family nitrate/nitrite transporter-like MFS transporter
MFLAYASGSFGFGIMSMAGFLVPLRAQELGAPLAVIGLIVGAGSVIAIVGSVPVGALTDRIGGRQVYVLSTMLCGTGAVLLALTDNYWGMLLIELVFGFPRTSVWIASQGYISCVGSPEERARIAGLFAFSSNGAALAAPLLVGLSAELLGFRDSFWVLVPVAAIYTVIGLALPDVRSGSAA